MTIFYTADLHLGHAYVAQLRGFDSADAHDTCILENIAAALSSNDTLFVLGDVTNGKDEREDELAYAKLKGTLDAIGGVDAHLILGNHEAAHPLHSKAHIALQRNYYRNTFQSITTHATHKFARNRAMIHHFPYSGDHSSPESRFEEYRLRDYGKPIVHGHTHATTPISFSTQGSVQCCVSVDAWGLRPVKKEVIDRLILTERAVRPPRFATPKR